MQPLWAEFQYQPHQVEGIQWMLEREKQVPSGGLLCDEMGLGKTIQMLGLMKEASVMSTLLVGPLAVLQQWQDAACRCGFQVYISHATKSEWLQVSPDSDEPSLYLINYERVVHRPSLVLDLEWDRLILDEAHRVGNTKTKAFQGIQKLQAKTKWFLTATPITNKLNNAISLLYLLGYETIPKTVDGLKQLVADTVLCRKMADLREVIPTLPQSAECIKHSLDFDTEEEAEFYRGIQGVIQRRWKMLEHEQGGHAERFRLIMRLRQISIHPQVYIAARKRAWRGYDRADFDEPSTKFTKLTQLIEEERMENHRWLIFCHFHDEMELLQDHLMESPVVRECGIYSGKSSPLERESLLATSKEPLFGMQQEVLLVQLMSGGVGLNLQHFDRIAFMGPWWTAAIMDQAIGRAVRIGQTKKVVVHHLVLKEEETMNIDITMLEKAEAKRSLCEIFLGYAKGQEKQSLS